MCPFNMAIDIMCKIYITTRMLYFAKYHKMDSRKNCMITCTTLNLLPIIISNILGVRETGEIGRIYDGANRGL